MTPYRLDEFIAEWIALPLAERIEMNAGGKWQPTWNHHMLDDFPAYREAVTECGRRNAVIEDGEK